MDRYDDDDENDEVVKAARIFGGESSMFHAHNDDAYMTVKIRKRRNVQRTFRMMTSSCERLISSS